MLIPVVLGVATILAALRATRPKKLTPEQLAIYQGALGEKPGTVGLADPSALRTLGRAFREQGFKAQALMLEKRAALKELPKELKAEYREALRAGLTCLDKGKVLALAKTFDEKGATGSADVLKKYAATLDSATSAIPKQKTEIASGEDDEACVDSGEDDDDDSDHPEAIE